MENSPHDPPRVACQQVVLVWFLDPPPPLDCDWSARLPIPSAAHSKHVKTTRQIGCTLNAQETITLFPSSSGQSMFVTGGIMFAPSCIKVSAHDSRFAPSALSFVIGRIGLALPLVVLLLSLEYTW